MNDLLLSEEGQTPLTRDDLLDLKPTHVTTRGQLNFAEQENILRAVSEMAGRNLTPDKILTEDFIVGLHRKMLSDVWRWAGAFRQRETTIGIDPREIRPELRKLLDDARYWVDRAIYPPDEICIRFAHRLVAIHLFPNGNGRHSRLAADILATALGQPEFPWGMGSGLPSAESRSRYIAALRAADAHDMGPLIAFARFS